MLDKIANVINKLGTVASETKDENVKKLALEVLDLLLDNKETNLHIAVDPNEDIENKYSVFLLGINSYIKKVTQMDSLILASSSKDCLINQKNLLIGGMEASNIIDHISVIFDKIPLVHKYFKLLLDDNSTIDEIAPSNEAQSKI